MNAPPKFRIGRRTRSPDSTLVRFGHSKIEPANVLSLKPDHPAILEGRTLFPKSVVDPGESPRVLISGRNNPKLGVEVRKGAWRGMPIYHLALEERKTCPRDCAVYDACYGDAMHLARRHRHGPDLLEALTDELAILSMDHVHGFVVRLHSLGDFYSADYVRFWETALDAVPNLHVFGYTACSYFSDEAWARDVAAEIGRITEKRWDRFAIRFSRPGAGPQGSMVVDKPVRTPDVIMCPAQTDKTAACATCALCWATAARNKAIAFLRHGRTRRRSALP